MYEDFNYNLEEFEDDSTASQSAWSDYGCEATEEILIDFTEEDWNQLWNELPEKSNIWKKRLSDCLTDTNNPNCLKTLLTLSTTEDMGLFTNVIMILTMFDLENIPAKDLLVEKVEKMMEREDNDRRNVFLNFLKKNKKIEEGKTE